MLLKDPDETSKITTVARKFDQLHMVLRLLDAYDSNEFQRLIYPLIANHSGDQCGHGRYGVRQDSE